MIRSLPALTLALVIVPSVAAAQPGYQVIAASTSFVDGLARTVETVQAGPNPIDHFTVYHVRHPGAAGKGRAVLLAPPLGTGFQFYENSDSGSYEDSFSGTLARRGFDVWGYSQRVQDLPAGTCESAAADCAVMAGWGLAQLAGDAEYVRSRLVAGHPGRRPVVGGMSLGGMIGLAAVDAHPGAYAGLITIDAGLYSTDATIIGITDGGCQALSAALAAGDSWSGQQIAFLKQVDALAQANPGGVSPFLPGTTNVGAWVTVLSTATPGPTSPTPSFIFDAGDPATGTLTYADPGFLHRGFDGWVSYISTAEVRDVDCSIAGDRTFTANLGAFNGAVFAVSAGHGFGTIVDDTLSLLQNAGIKHLAYPGLGHQDVFFATDHRARLDKPLLRWLETEAFE